MPTWASPSRQASAELTLLFSVVGLFAGIFALLGLGWDGSPLKLNPTGAIAWAAIGIVFAGIDLAAFASTPGRRFLAQSSLAACCIALLAALLVLAAFAPCGKQCI
jgi:hypothetical protein